MVFSLLAAPNGPINTPPNRLPTPRLRRSPLDAEQGVARAGRPRPIRPTCWPPLPSPTGTGRRLAPAGNRLRRLRMAPLGTRSAPRLVPLPQDSPLRRGDHEGGCPPAQSNLSGGGAAGFAPTRLTRAGARCGRGKRDRYAGRLPRVRALGGTDARPARARTRFRGRMSGVARHVWPDLNAPALAHVQLAMCQ